MAWIHYQNRNDQQKKQVAERAELANPGQEPAEFYDQQELGLLSEVALQAWLSEQTAKPAADEPPSYNESDAYQIRTLRWLMNNAETAADKSLARQRYREILFTLWRKHVALTGDTYYKGLREEIWERYQSHQHDLA